MIDVSGIRLSLDAALPGSVEQCRREVARALGVKPAALQECVLVRRSVDARKRSDVHFTTTFRLALDPAAEERLLAKPPRGCTVRPWKEPTSLRYPRCSAGDRPRPVVVGLGPAGLFAALYLARCGLRPLVVERGADVDARGRDVERFQQTGVLDPESNIQFGEGGAGTFSDGKLTTNIKNKLAPHVLRWFVEAGAPESILVDAHPHLGSDNLPGIVRTMREEIVSRGGEVLFNTRLVDWSFEEGALSRVTLERTADGEREDSDQSFAVQAAGQRFDVAADALILACGHSARDVFALAQGSGLSMERKPFSVGVRIEHPQSLINESQWGAAAAHPALGAAEYKLAVHLPGGRSVYTFCMCPGGEVVAAASEEGGIVTNGMSRYARDGRNANAALLVNVDPTDFEGDDVLAGVELQRRIERAAFRSSAEHGGAPYQAPCQSVGAFLAERGAAEPATRSKSASVAPTCGKVRPTYARGVVEAPIAECLPPFVVDALAQALPRMGRKIKGFDDPNALMTAPETRSSSPVRIRRGRDLQARIGAGDVDLETAVGCGIYPCGEGPGFAGGIMSAACDGLRVAQELAATYVRDEAARALRAGEAVVFPTDTVFGLGVSVRHAQSPEVLYRIKDRDAGKPIAWLVGDVDDLVRYGDQVPDAALRLARAFWPGPLTVIVRAGDAVPQAFRSQAGTIGLRMPANPTALALIRAVGCPLATTSANASGGAEATSFADLDPGIIAQVAAAIDDDMRKSGIASTIIDCSQPGDPLLIREGAITADDLFAQK